MTRILNYQPLWRLVLGVAIMVGLLAGGIGYLASALSVPAPAQPATLEQMQQRGADVYVAFCEKLPSEPRFWPECKNDADAWRARGAERMVALCTEGVRSRMLNADACVNPGAPVALTRSVTWGDAALGAGAAAATGVILGLLALSYRVLGARRSPSPG